MTSAVNPLVPTATTTDVRAPRPQNSLVSRCLAECLGTAGLVFVAAGIVPNQSATSGALATAAAFLSLATPLAPISGAHFNPAISVSFFVLERLSWRALLVYVAAQMLGSVLAVMTLSLCGIHASTALGIVGTTSLRGQLLSEAVLSFLLSFTIFRGVVSPSEQVNVLQESLSVRLLQVAAAVLVVSLLGACCNPARALGPALFRRCWTHHWAAWVGPTVGAVTGALVSEHVFGAKDQTPRSILQRYWVSKGNRLESSIRRLGIAGLIAYGFLNTLYYSVAFLLVWTRVAPGGASIAGRLASSWALVWAGSQITKPIRLLVAVAMTPVIQTSLLDRGKQD